MKISYNWLKQYISVDMEAAKAGEALTSSGLEVEDIYPYESLKGGLRGVVTGKVLHCERHPNADKLSLTKVDVGSGEPLSIVCGAPNVAEGQKVLVATVGTILFKGEESFEIKKSKIRGELSEGMICAEDELGLGTSHEGIMVLDPSTEVGLPAHTIFSVENDQVFEIGLTPNRSDAASHIGVARDLAAVLNHREGQGRYRLQLSDVDAFTPDNHQLPIGVEVDDPQACPRYSGLTLSGIKVEPSPEWLVNRLKAIGLRPINNVVDITNYVLFETGQPLHAFDASAIKGQKVVVCKPAAGTIFVTLDGVERKLTGNDLMICNAEEGMCIGGVFGGLGSGVTESTTAIFLESACFDSKTIRKTARHHGLQTDASFRFERGSDPNNTLYALKRAAMLIKEVAGGSISSDIVDVYPVPVKPARVNLRFDYLNRIAGQAIDKSQALGILQDLGLKIVSEDHEEVLLEVPTYKVDVYRPADLAEEVLRVYGYDNIRIPDKLNASLNIQRGHDADKLQHAVADMLAARGFYEIMNNSLVPSDSVSKHPGFDQGKSVRMLNPLSKDLDSLRQSLLFGGLETVAYNQNRKNADLRLFEFGKVYHFDAQRKSTEEAPLAPYFEELRLDLFLTGEREAENWNVASGAVNFFDLKEVVEALMYKLRLMETKHQATPFADDVFEFGLEIRFGEKTLIRAGLLNAATTKAYDIRKPVYYASLAWQQLLSLIPTKAVRFEALPKFPAVRRDLALVLDQGVRFETLEAIALKTEPRLLRQLTLFDVYEGDKIPAGKKSYALGFVLQDKEATLTDKVIDKTMQRLQLAFEQQAGASLR